eukprot:TRINITY_DN2031_c0_g1_i3.p1 TRINITY_DN2031_c0_g1~~TRINITY_DN2031_c0_g1_i3.p1  ORF type:complete len:316 (+),score=67.41 TRINITY_DN2031_c0_g1_i3:634-1581(+)
MLDSCLQSPYASYIASSCCSFSLRFILLSVPLKAAAIEEKTVVHEVPSSLKSLKSFRPETIEPGKFDLGVVVSFGYFIPEHILNLFPDGAINVHPSLLPKYRGPAPIYHTILNKDAETGVSIIEVDRKAFDVGDILAQKSIKIDPNAKYNQLLKSLSDVSCQLLVDSLRSLDLLRSSREIQPTQNHTAEFARAPKVTTEMGALMWNSDEFLDIYARYKAFSENMGVFTHFQGKRIKIIEMIPASPEAELDNTLSKLGPGHILYWSRTKQLFVVTKDKKCFQLIQLQVEGRKALSAVEFANGFRLSASTPVCFQDI